MPVANSTGSVVGTIGDNGKMELCGDDPLVADVLGHTHCMSSFRAAVRSVIVLWASKEDREEFRAFMTNSYARGGTPGWDKYKALDRHTKRILLSWVYIIQKRHRNLHTNVMAGRI